MRAERKERREFARLNMEAEASYKQKGKENIQNAVLLQDMSLSGVRFICNEALRENTVLEIILNIPGVPTPISVEGKVVWQKRFSKSFFDTGIEFTEIMIEERNKLSKYIGSQLGRLEERRGFIRCNLSTMVKYKIAGSSHLENNCLTVDVSSTGLRVFMKEKLDCGTKVQLSFNLPDESEPVSAEGVIVWEKVKEDNFVEAGIEFTSIEDRYMEKINDYVKKNLGINW